MSTKDTTEWFQAFRTVKKTKTTPCQPDLKRMAYVVQIFLRSCSTLVKLCNNPLIEFSKTHSKDKEWTKEEPSKFRCRSRNSWGPLGIGGVMSCPVFPISMILFGEFDYMAVCFWICVIQNTINGIICFSFYCVTHK